MTLFNPMRALTVIAELGLNALATVLDPGPGVPADFLRAAVGADELADAEAEQEVAEPVGEHGTGVTVTGSPRTIYWGEPPLAGSELIAVRQLIEERFPEFTAPSVDGAAGDPSPSTGEGPASGPDAGHLTCNDLMDAARAARFRADSWLHCDHAHWLNLADRLEDAAIAVASASAFEGL